MEKPLISVIIPVYGVEEFLDQCVTYVVEQTYENLEIILVDDGSKDSCPQMCDVWAEKDNRIKVIHKENGGLSDARNAGLRIASGQYISFIDSDDYIEKFMYENMIETMLDMNADIVECGTRYVLDDKILRSSKVDQVSCYTRTDAMKELISESAFHQTVWNKLYKVECIGETEFKVGKYNEDEFWTYQVFHNTKKCVAIPECYYQYRQRENSIMSEFSYKRLDGLEARYERMQFIEKCYPEFLQQEKLNFVFNCIYFYQKIMQNPDMDKCIEGKKKVKQYFKTIKFNSNEWKALNGKQKLYIKLADISLEGCSRLRNLLNIGV